MATNELQARITADISGLESGLKKAQRLQADYGKSISRVQKEISQNITISKGYERAIEQLNNEFKNGQITQKQYQKQLQRLQRDEKETAIDTRNLRKELTRLKRDQKDLAATSTKTSKGMTSFGKSTSNATPSVIEFSRVIQDAPFGIQGVANNIQQLTTNFGYLRTQAGGTIPALKAFGSSFLGPAGIVFAVSTITSLLVSFGDELFNSANSTKKLSSAISKFVGEAQAEIVSLRSLVAIAQDKSKSDQVRAQAIEELNDKYGDYLGNLTLEEIGTDAVNDSVNRLTRSLIKQAQVRGIEARIQEVVEDSSKDLVDAQLELSEAYRSVQRQARGAIKSNAALRDRIKDGLGTEDLVKEIVRVSKVLDIPPPVGLVQSIGRVNELNEEVKDLKKESERSLKPLQELLTSVTADKLLLDSQSEGQIEGIVVTLDEYKKKQEEILEASEKQRKVYKEIGEEAQKLASGLEVVSPEIKANEGGIIPDIGEDTSKYVAQLNRAITASELFSDASRASFNALGQSLAQTFETGNAALDAFVGTLIKGLSDIAIAQLTALVQQQAYASSKIASDQAVATSSAISSGAQTASASGPAAAFVLPALIAGAVALVAGAFGNLKFATGGIVPGGSFQGDKIPAMLNSGEMVLNSRQQSNLFRMLDGNLGVSPQPQQPIDLEGVVRGSNLLLVTKRANRSSKRFSAG